MPVADGAGTQRVLYPESSSPLIYGDPPCQASPSSSPIFWAARKDGADAESVCSWGVRSTGWTRRERRKWGARVGGYAGQAPSQFCPWVPPLAVPRLCHPSVPQVDSALSRSRQCCRSSGREQVSVHFGRCFAVPPPLT